MSEICFESSLTNEEIEKTLRIMERLNDALAYEKDPSLVDILLQ